MENISNLNQNACPFLPYNAVIVEVGSGSGNGSLALCQTYPYGRVYAFEPHPNIYSLLKERVKSCSNISIFNLAVSVSNNTQYLYGEGDRASLIHLTKDGDNRIAVPCVVLDDWCRINNLDHIDFLRLDAGGFELDIIKSSPEILKSVIVIVTKTYMSSNRGLNYSFSKMKNYLDNLGFEFYSHWYQEGKEGEATFVRKYMYDSIFR